MTVQSLKCDIASDNRLGFVLERMSNQTISGEFYWMGIKKKVPYTALFLKLGDFFDRIAFYNFRVHFENAFFVTFIFDSL